MTKTMGKEEILDSIAQMSVLDLSELVKQIEEKFGVTAAAPVAVTGGGAVAVGDAGAEAEEQTEFTPILAAIGDKKIQVIKVVREITGLGLKEAKDLVDGAPKSVKEGIPKNQAEEIQKKLTEVGATVEIK